MVQSVSNSIKRRIDIFRREQRRRPRARRLLVEGDSWFTYGHFMWVGKTLAAKLSEYATINLVSVANPGAELEDLVKQHNRDWGLANNPTWLKGQTYDAVLFSGGGNDIVGTELKNYLHRKTSARSGTNLINQSALNRALDWMGARYHELRATVDAFVLPSGSGKVPIITHGYDYAFPSGQGLELIGGLLTVGPWILPNFVEKGIDDTAEQLVILNELVDRFNALLNDLQRGQTRKIEAFHYVDLRNTLRKTDWADELHPTAAGRDRLAAKLRAEIVRIL